MTDQKKAAVLAEISLVLAAVFWGANYAATKYAAEFMSPLLVVAFRFLVGGALVSCLLLTLKPADRIAPKDLLPVAGLGCLYVAIGQGTFTLGIHLTSAANTGLIFATSPVWGLLLGSILGRYLGWSAPRGEASWVLASRSLGLVSSSTRASRPIAWAWRGICWYSYRR